MTDILVASDAYLHTLKVSLKASAVLKAELASVKSSCGDSNVFAYEGVDDKLIYGHWLLKTAPDLEYEPFICRNKDQLLQLLKSLEFDLTGMGENVFFFTDRDFDDLREYEGTEAVFMTEKYSVENYLVNCEVLTELLKIEFHCHGNLEVRESIISIFNATFDDFLEKTSEINFRIYLARKCKIKQCSDFSIRFDDLAEVRIASVGKGKGNLKEIVFLEREPSEVEIARHQGPFGLLNRKDRYRGKFALQFFRKWLVLLLADRNAEDSKFFIAMTQNNLIAKGSFSFENLAAKSKPPESFQHFISKILPGAEHGAVTT